MKKIIILLSILAINMTLYAQPHYHKQTKSRVLNNMINDSYLPYIIKVSAEVGIFELLNDKSMTVTEVTEALQTQKRVTDALLGVLNASSILDYKDGKYSLSETALKYLVASSEDNEIHWLNENIAMPSGEIAELKEVLTGKRQAPKNTKKSRSNWQNKESLIQMKDYFKKSSGEIVDFFETLPEFSQSKKMMDYAGSVGYFAMAILDRNKNLKAEVYDLPVVCDIAKEIQKDEKNFDRVSFHGFDIRNNDPIGSGYDLFFASNALYAQRTKEQLVQFFTQANKSMEIGGVIVSNHWKSNHESKAYLAMTVEELLLSYTGRPVHYIEEDILKQVLHETGFDNFTVKVLNEDAVKPRLLIAARKVKNL